MLDTLKAVSMSVIECRCVVYQAESVCPLVAPDVLRQMSTRDPIRD